MAAQPHPQFGGHFRNYPLKRKIDFYPTSRLYITPTDILACVIITEITIFQESPLEKDCSCNNLLPYNHWPSLMTNSRETKISAASTAEATSSFQLATVNQHTKAQSRTNSRNHHSAPK